MTHTATFRHSFHAEKVGLASCGLLPGPEDFNYEVTIVARDLDRLGFVIDVRLIIAYFHMRWAKVGVAGEEIARIAAGDLWCDRFESIEVKIQNTRFSFVTYTKQAEHPIAAEGDPAQLGAELLADPVLSEPPLKSPPIDRSLRHMISTGLSIDPYLAAFQMEAAADGNFNLVDKVMNDLYVPNDARPVETIVLEQDPAF